VRPLFYTEAAPAPALADRVVSHWMLDVRLPAGESYPHRVWSDGCVSILVVCRDGTALAALVAGPTLAARVVPVQGGTAYRGARLWPDAGGAVVGLPAPSLRDRTIPLADAWGAAADALARDVAAAPPDAVGAAFDRHLGARVGAAPAIDPAVRAAVRAAVESDGQATVAELAARGGLSPRQLQRRFGRATGLTPKEYLRVRRARATIAASVASDATWGALSARFGYADQAHLVRDLTEVAGVTPREVEARLLGIEHGAFTP
jgi:AraC-like DNA-binding protein